MDKKMKIAFLSLYSGEVYRGVETFVHELANRFTDLGIDVIVYQNGPELKNSKYKTVSIDLKIDWNVVSREVNPPRIPFTDYWGFLVKRFTSRVLRKIDKDVDIIIPTNGGWQTLLTKIWTVLHHKKMVVTGQSGPGIDDRWMLWCFPDRFIGLSEFHTKWARKANPFVKSLTIHDGADLKIFGSDVKPIKTGLKRPIILNVGAFIPNKRQKLIIKAVSKLEHVSLLLVGKGDMEDELSSFGEKLLPGRFKIMSFAYDQMSKVYTACDLFTFPTVSWESFGIVMVEAMASGLPVIATDDPIRREIVGEAGLFVDPTDSKKYAETLEKALKIKWGTKPKEQAEKFSWDDIAKKYRKMFEELC